jgi:CubicO group peptidase (beta-lactamase class C family)
MRGGGLQPQCMHLAVAVAAMLHGRGGQAQGLGPGRGPWRVDRAENHGLSQAALDEAAQKTAEVAPERNCLLVVKDGVIIEEKYFGINTSASVYETDSLGKTSIAALFGVAVQQGLIDIDTPLTEFGVHPASTTPGSGGPQFEEGHSWGSFWPQITVRTLLAQSSGYGEVPPGSAFTYDSDEYIQHLSYALSAVVPNKTGGALQWARDNYAVPLGIPEFFDYDNIGEAQGGPTQIASAGGQMVTCREMARFGQLMLNKGKWLDAAGQPYQMASPTFIQEMMSPAFPGVVDGYGFLTWL